jgi:hypothetical protein
LKASLKHHLEAVKRATHFLGVHVELRLRPHLTQRGRNTRTMLLQEGHKIAQRQSNVLQLGGLVRGLLIIGISLKAGINILLITQPKCNYASRSQDCLSLPLSSSSESSSTSSTTSSTSTSTSPSLPSSSHHHHNHNHHHHPHHQHHHPHHQHHRHHRHHMNIIINTNIIIINIIIIILIAIIT